MSIFLQRKEQLGWFEPSDRTEISPASLWAPEYEDEIAQIKARAFRAPKSPRPNLIPEPELKETPGEIKEPLSNLWTQEEIVDTQANEQPQGALPRAPALLSEDTHEGTLANNEMKEEEEHLPTTSSFVSVVTPKVESRPETPSNVTADEQPEPGPPEAKVKSAVLPRKIPRRPLVLDESAVLPNEASYATVAMHRDVFSRSRVLDETAVLPGEASYATVPVHRDVVSRPRVLDASAVLPNEASYATVPMNRDVFSRSRVLDETAVPPGEASFSTLRLDQKPGRSHYSAHTFTSRFAHRARQLLPALLVIAVCSAAIMFRMKFKTASHTVQSVSEVTPATEPMVLQPGKTNPEPEPTTTANPSEAVTLSSSPKEPTNAPLATDTPIEHRVAVAPKVAEKTVPRIRREREARSNKNVGSESKESDVVSRKVPIPRSNRDDAPVESASTARSEPVMNSANDAPKTETKSQPAVAGGGARPRRVNQPVDPTP